MSDINQKTFDAVADDYKSEVQRSIGFSGLSYDLFTQSKIDLISLLLKPDQAGNPLHLLDLGCGVGTLHAGLASLNIKVDGVDVSAKSLDIARSLHPLNNYYSIHANRLPISDNTYDCVLAVCVVHHVQPLDRSVFFSEAYRVLKPGGSLIVIEHNPFNPLTRVVVARCEFDRDASLIRRSSLLKLLGESGFVKPHGGYFMYLPFSGIVFRSLELLTPRLPLGTQYYVRITKPSSC